MGYLFTRNYYSTCTELFWNLFHKKIFITLPCVQEHFQIPPSCKLNFLFPLQSTLKLTSLLTDMIAIILPLVQAGGSILIYASKGSRKPTGKSKELLTKVKHNKEVYKIWMQGLVTQKEYMCAVWACRDRVRKAKATESWARQRDVKGKRDFSVSSERKTWENVGMALVTKNSLPC